jgi:hypothetical protein
MRKILLSAATLLLALSTSLSHSQDTSLSFFITSVGSGNGANLGGLAGADAHCAALATAVGAGGKTWRAYLSTQAAGGQPAVNARDRIGAGPWYNAKGVQIAANLEQLHSEAALTGKDNSLTEAGALVNGRGDTPNQHDILTGSQADGTAFTDAKTTLATTGQAAVPVPHRPDTMTVRAEARIRPPGTAPTAPAAAARKT